MFSPQRQIRLLFFFSFFFLLFVQRQISFSLLISTTKENHNVGPKIQNVPHNTRFYKYQPERDRLNSSLSKHFSVTGMFVRDKSLPFHHEI